MLYHVYFDLNPETGGAVAQVDVPGDAVPNVGAHLRGYHGRWGRDYAFQSLQPAASATREDYAATMDALEAVHLTAIQHPAAKLTVTWED